jgi:hypothetical protein
MTTTRDDLHARIDQLSDEQLAQAAALLDALTAAGEPLPPGRRGMWAELVALMRAERPGLREPAQQHAHEAATNPPPMALEALGDYVGARPGLTDNLLANAPHPDADPTEAELVDDQRRQLAGLGKRESRILDERQREEAVAAGAARWR